MLSFPDIKLLYELREGPAASWLSSETRQSARRLINMEFAEKRGLLRRLFITTKGREAASSIERFID